MRVGSTRTARHGSAEPWLGACPVCHRKVELGKKGTCRAHIYRGGPCRGVGEPGGPIVGICSVCAYEQPLRLRDGRIAAHHFMRETCEGSGKSPARGRNLGYMKGQGASKVFR